jgi:hypothetical protein
MSHQQTSAPSPLADDILFGATAIAAELGWPERRVYYLAERKALPVDKLGGTLVSTKSRLRSFFAGDNASAATAS